MKLLVGCPVSNRSWILDDWFKHVVAAAKDYELEFIFLIPEMDIEDLAILDNYTDYTRHLIISDEDSYVNRSWNGERYEVMANLRNNLLDGVRQIEPDLFLSLDSDILLHPDGISNLIETYQNNDCIAVGGKTYLDFTSKFYPSYSKWTGQTYHRPDFSGIMQVDILMAIKLMGPDAWSIDYQMHRNGEDFGWSVEAAKHGRLMWDGRITNKHVMRPEDKDKIDPRCGF